MAATSGPADWGAITTRPVSRPVTASSASLRPDGVCDLDDPGPFDQSRDQRVGEVERGVGKAASRVAAGREDLGRVVRLDDEHGGGRHAQRLGDDLQRLLHGGPGVAILVQARHDATQAVELFLLLVQEAGELAVGGVVGDQRADAIGERLVACVEDHRIAHRDDDHGQCDVGKPVVGIRLPRLDELVDGQRDQRRAHERDDQVPDRRELVGVVLAVEDGQRQIGDEVDDDDQDRAQGRGFGEQRHRVDVLAVRPGEHQDEADAGEGQQGVDRRLAPRVDAADPGGQQALAAGVEQQPRLRVHGGDQAGQRRGDAGQVGEEGQHAEHAVGDRDEGDRRGAERGDVLAEALDGGVGEEHVAHHHEGDAGKQGARHVATRVLGLLGQRRRVLPADEQIDGEGEPESESLEPVREVARVEGMQGQMAGVVGEGAHRHHDQHDHLEGEEDAGPARRDVDAAHHEERGETDEDDHEPGPRRGRDRGDVVVQEDRREAARHHEHRDDGDDVAGDQDDRRGDRARRAEGLADEGDERAGRRVRPRELGQRVAEEGDGHARRDDGER